MRACYVAKLNHTARPRRRKQKQMNAVRCDAMPNTTVAVTAAEPENQQSRLITTTAPQPNYCNVHVFFFDMPDSLSPGRLLKPCMYMSRRRRVNNRRKGEKIVSEVPNMTQTSEKEQAQPQV